jgi:hypothetical protein
MPRSSRTGTRRTYRADAGTRFIFEMETESINDVIRSMRDFNANARRAVVKKALREFGSALVRRIKSNIKWGGRNTRRAVVAKVNRYPKGGRPETRKYLWLGVGVRTGMRPPGKAVMGRYGEMFPGWRAHFYEAGWRAWPKGRRATDEVSTPRRRGNYRGGDPSRARAILAFVRRDNRWRKGKRGVVGGAPHYETRFMRRAGMALAPTLRGVLERSVESARREMSRG